MLAVNDLKRSVAFYCENLGFKVDFETEGWSFLSRDEMKLMLGHCPDETPASEIRDHSWFAYVSAEGIDSLYQEWKSKGVEFIQHIANKPWGKREFGILTPDGHRIIFGEDIA